MRNKTATGWPLIIEDFFTAQEGADRVAVRLRAPRREDEPPAGSPYCCESCRGREFFVECTFQRSETRRATLACTCGARHKYAARRTRRSTHVCREVYPLGEDHELGHAVAGTLEKLEGGTDEDLEREVVCARCFEAATDDQWDPQTIADSDVARTALEYWVRCRACHHEVEFGWSQPDRGGQVWPCESADFQPLSSFPEPRYAQAWMARGWRSGS
jgi:hypothetical protein